MKKFQSNTEIKIQFFNVSWRKKKPKCVCVYNTFNRAHKPYSDPRQYC